MSRREPKNVGILFVYLPVKAMGNEPDWIRTRDLLHIKQPQEFWVAPFLVFVVTYLRAKLIIKVAYFGKAKTIQEKDICCSKFKLKRMSADGVLASVLKPKHLKVL